MLIQTGIRGTSLGQHIYVSLTEALYNLYKILMCSAFFCLVIPAASKFRKLLSVVSMSALKGSGSNQIFDGVVNAYTNENQ